MQMPRITPLRFLFFVSSIFFVLFIAFWNYPSPAYSAGLERQEHIEQVARSGQTLTTIHNFDEDFISSDSSRARSKSHVAIDWRLQPCRGSVLLWIGGGNNNRPINLTDTAFPQPQNTPNLGGPNPYIVKTCNIASTSYYPQPSFDRADEALLEHQVNPTYDALYLRSLAPGSVEGSGEVQIWKHHEAWSRFTSMKDIDDDDRYRGLLITFSGIPAWSSAFSDDASSSCTGGDYINDPANKKLMSQVQISVADNAMITTKNFAMRSWLLTLCYPLFLAFHFLVMIASSQPVLMVFGIFWASLHIAALYFGTVLVVWLTKGRPEFASWSRKHWFTSWLFRFVSVPAKKKAIWGASGPVDGDGEEGDDDDDGEHKVPQEGEEPQRQRMPLRTPFDFFRSSAPLDDLLYMFEVTRWMVEPLRWRNSRGGVEAAAASGWDPEAASASASLSDVRIEKENPKVRIVL